MSDIAKELIRHEGLFCHSFIGQLSRTLPATTYLEIGTSTGDSLAAVDCSSIAVDPNFLIGRNVVGAKPACHLFQMTSDAFFAEVDPTAVLGARVDLAFLDGLHLFEYLLRDFINTEKHCAPDSVILLHDCLPPTFEMTSRVVKGEPGNEAGAIGHPDYAGYWTGDVWKVAAILREYRPDLRLLCLNSPPTGLILCTRLDPHSMTLTDRYEDITRRFAPSDKDQANLEAFLRQVELTDTSQLTTRADLAARLGPRRGGAARAVQTADDFLKAMIESRQPRRIVWIAHETPDWLLSYSIPLLIVSPTAPTVSRPGDIWIEQYPSLIDEAASAKILASIEGREEELDLAFLNGDHSLSSLRSQLLILTEANPRIAVALACAVPPRLDMTGPEQTPGQWWVGEVWAAIAWLRRAQKSLRSAVVDADPVGFGALYNVSHKILEEMDIGAARSELADVQTLADIRSAIGVVEAGQYENEIRGWPDRRTPGPELRLLDMEGLEADASVKVELLQAARPFVRPCPVVIADLSRHGIGHELSAPKTVMAPRKIWAGIPDATIRGYFLLELSDGRLLFPRIASSDGSRAFADHIKRSSGSRRSGVNYHSGLRWLRDECMLIDDGRLVELEGDVFWATPDEPENWGVWLAQTLPALIYADSIGFDGSVLAYVAGPWQHALVAHFAPRLARRLINQEFSRTYQVRGRTWVLAQENRNFVLGDFDREIFDRVAKLALANTGGELGHQKLFISRQSRSRKTPFYRALLNEAELAEALEDEGFHTIEPETLSFDQQIAAFARARYVVGAGGAGLFNAVFCKPGSSIFSIESSNRWIEAHANLFASAGLHYSVAFGREIERDEPPHKRWTISVDHIVPQIRRADPLGSFPRGEVNPGLSAS